MPAIVEIDESNGAVEVVTHGIITANYGATDTPNLATTTAPLTPGTNSYEKAHRWHVTAMGGAVSVRAFRFWASAPGADAGHFFNGSTTQATYDSANHKATAYAAPATTATRTPETVPQSPPATGNIGVGGSLVGELLAPGYTDYLYSQIRTGAAALAGTTITNSYRYEEVGVMQPFRVRDVDAPAHTASTPCPACLAGYPQPCLRITDQGFKPVGYDAAGQAMGTAWTVTRCAGLVHAESGLTGVLETRCAACGVPP